MRETPYTAIVDNSLYKVDRYGENEACKMDQVSNIFAHAAFEIRIGQYSTVTARTSGD